MASPTRFASGTKTTNWRHTQSWSTQSYAMHTRSVLVRDGLTLHLSQLTQAATVHKTVEVLRKAAKAEAMQGALRGDARAAKRRAEELQNEIEKMCVGVRVGGLPVWGCCLRGASVWPGTTRWYFTRQLWTRSALLWPRHQATRQR